MSNTAPVEAEAPPQAVDLRLTGEPVRVHGLASGTGSKLNGMSGVALRWKNDSGRWEVQLDAHEPGKTMGIKPGNLHQLASALPVQVFEAGERGDAQAVAAWLSHGHVDAPCHDRGRATLLMSAASGGHADVLQLLLEQGASANAQSAKGLSALHIACERGHQEAIVTLARSSNLDLQSGERGSTVLMKACGWGDANLLQTLLDVGADVTMRARDGNDAMSIAKGRHQAMVRQGHEEEAAKAESCVQVLENDAAAKRAACFQAMGEAGVAMARGEYREAKPLPLDLYGNATEAGVAAWLREGGSVDARCTSCYDRTLLGSAAGSGNVAMVRWLLEQKASIDLQNSDGCSPLMEAASSPFDAAAVVKLLLDAGADTMLRDSRGQTAAQRARHACTPLPAPVESRTCDPNVCLAVAADGDNTAVRKLLNVDASLPKPLPGWFYVSTPGPTGELNTRYDPLTR